MSEKDNFDKKIEQFSGIKKGLFSSPNQRLGEGFEEIKISPPPIKDWGNQRLGGRNEERGTSQLLKNKEDNSFTTKYKQNDELLSSSNLGYNKDSKYANLYTSYSKISEIKLASIDLASSKTIRRWAEKTLPNGKILGEVTSANTLHHKSFKPLKGGLFCERIFGPLRDFECACGTRQRPTEEEYKRIIEHQQTERKFCPTCDVEYTWSIIRRYQLGYIQLVSPVSHIWYLKANPSYLSILLDMKRSELESIIYCSKTSTLENSWKLVQDFDQPTSTANLFQSWQRLISASSYLKNQSLSNKNDKLRFSLISNKTSLSDIYHRKKRSFERKNRSLVSAERFLYWRSFLKKWITSNSNFISPLILPSAKYFKLQQFQSNKLTNNFNTINEINCVENCWQYATFQFKEGLKEKMSVVILEKALKFFYHTSYKLAQIKTILTLQKIGLFHSTPQSFIVDDFTLKTNIYLNSELQNQILFCLQKSLVHLEFKTSKKEFALKRTILIKLLEKIEFTNFTGFDLVASRFFSSSSKKENKMGEKNFIKDKDSSTFSSLLENENKEKTEIASSTEAGSSLKYNNQMYFLKSDKFITKIQYYLKKILISTIWNKKTLNILTFFKKEKTILMFLNKIVSNRLSHLLLQHQLKHNKLITSLNDKNFLIKEKLYHKLNESIALESTNNTCFLQFFYQEHQFRILLFFIQNYSNISSNNYFYNFFYPLFMTKLLISEFRNFYGIYQQQYFLSNYLGKLDKNIDNISYPVSYKKLEKRNNNIFEHFVFFKKQNLSKTKYFKHKNFNLYSLQQKDTCFSLYFSLVLGNTEAPSEITKKKDKIKVSKSSPYLNFKQVTSAPQSFSLKEASPLFSGSPSKDADSGKAEKGSAKPASANSPAFSALPEKKPEEGSAKPCKAKKATIKDCEVHKDWGNKKEQMKTKNIFQMNVFPFQKISTKVENQQKTAKVCILGTFRLNLEKVSLKQQINNFKLSQKEVIVEKIGSKYNQKRSLIFEFKEHNIINNIASKQGAKRLFSFTKYNQKSQNGLLHKFTSDMNSKSKEKNRTRFKNLFNRALRSLSDPQSLIGEKDGQQKDFKKSSLNQNIIYSLSHRYGWNSEKNWQYFSYYNLAPRNLYDISIPFYKNRSLNSINSFNSILVKQMQFHDDFTEQPFTGASVVQKFLSEFHSNELKKMDKQNRIFLYEFYKIINVLKILVKNDCAEKWEKKQLKELCQKRDHLIRRTKLIRKIFRRNNTTSQNSPLSMILTVLPVLPPDLRPILKMQNQIASSDLNRLYQRVIYRNDRLKKFRSKKMSLPISNQSFEIKYAQRLLQEAVDNLIQNGKGGPRSRPERDSRGRPLKSLSEILKGKQGRFRQYLLGKRVDYSGRSVIVVGPKLKIHECGLPKEMALELFLPFLIQRILHYKFARTVIGAKTLIKTNKNLTLYLLSEIMQSIPIFLNRAPTLHRLGIQAFQPKLIDGRAILLHPLVCPAFNADFDGDQMAVHIPLTVEARAEAWKLMFSRNHLISAATGDPIMLPSQDMVLGCYYLTTEVLTGYSFVPPSADPKREKAEHKFKTDSHQISLKKQLLRSFSLSYFNTFEQVIKEYQLGKLHLHSSIWVKWSSFAPPPSPLGEEKEEASSPLFCFAPPPSVLPPQSLIGGQRCPPIKDWGRGRGKKAQSKIGSWQASPMEMTISTTLPNLFLFSNGQRKITSFFLQQNNKSLHSPSSISIPQSKIGDSQEKKSLSSIYPLEIRLNTTGYWQEIRYKQIRSFDQKNTINQQYIRTTPGRILFHQVVKQCIVK